MARNLTLSIVVLVLALLFVGLGWLLGRLPAGAPAVTPKDLAAESAAVIQSVEGRTEALARLLEARADRLERKLDILLNIATNVPPDLRK